MGRYKKLRRPKTLSTRPRSIWFSPRPRQHLLSYHTITRRTNLWFSNFLDTYTYKHAAVSGEQKGKPKSPWTEVELYRDADDCCGAFPPGKLARVNLNVSGKGLFFVFPVDTAHQRRSRWRAHGVVGFVYRHKLKHTVPPHYRQSNGKRADKQGEMARFISTDEKAATNSTVECRV